MNYVKIGLVISLLLYTGVTIVPITDQANEIQIGGEVIIENNSTIPVEDAKLKAFNYNGEVVEITETDRYGRYGFTNDSIRKIQVVDIGHNIISDHSDDSRIQSIQSENTKKREVYFTNKEDIKFNYTGISLPDKIITSERYKIKLYSYKNSNISIAESDLRGYQITHKEEIDQGLNIVSIIPPQKDSYIIAGSNKSVNDYVDLDFNNRESVLNIRNDTYYYQFTGTNLYRKLY